MTVYRTYAADELELQYNARLSIPDHPLMFARWAASSALAALAIELQKMGR